MRPARECYARAWVQLDGLEVHMGVECRDGDNPEELSEIGMDFLGLAFELADTDATVLGRLEEMIVHEWPDRAYFVESERAGAGVQIFQPWGLPRNPPTTDSQGN